MSETSIPKPRLPAILAAVWLAVVVGMMLWMIGYDSSAGTTGAMPNQWPPGSRIVPEAGLPNLIVFAHPRCPCTRATIGELEIVMARSGGKLRAQVWFIQPAGTGGDWAKSDLWRSAAAIPGVSVHADADRSEALRFHAETSGQTLLYDSEGELRFQGGITISRGHAGDNPGREAIFGLVEKPLSGLIRTPVFGCPLFEAHCGEGGGACPL